MDDLTTDIRRIGSSMTVTVSGDLDVKTAPVFCAQLLCALDSGEPVGTLVIDLDDLGSMDAAGFDALAALSRAARRRGVAVTLAVREDRASSKVRATPLARLVTWISGTDTPWPEADESVSTPPPGVPAQRGTGRAGSDPS